jgi:hypothetical protein
LGKSNLQLLKKYKIINKVLIISIIRKEKRIDRITEAGIATIRCFFWVFHFQMGYDSLLSVLNIATA